MSGDAVKMDELKADLKAAKDEISTLKDRLQRSEKLLDRANKYNDDLRDEMEKLKKKLHRYKKAAKHAKRKTEKLKKSKEMNIVDVAVQTEALSTNKTSAAAHPSVTEGVHSHSAGSYTEPCTSTTEEKDWTEGPQGGISIADSIKAAAEDAMQQTGFVYDETTGLYYDYSSGYYYDSEKSLYYDPHSGTYFYFNEEKNEYEFHSQVDLRQLQKDLDAERKEHQRRRREQDQVTQMTEALKSLNIQQLKKNALETVMSWPPCIRAMVLASELLDPGSLFIVTCSGATIGREKDLGHAIVIPDAQISKMHCDIHYSEESGCYMLKDHASQNGTFLNGQRIAKPKVMGVDQPLKHKDLLRLGDTTLELHIHPGTETCFECEPGQVQARLQKQDVDDVMVVSKEDKERLRREQLKNIKKKFGLAACSYEDNKAVFSNPKYSDKATERRKTKGSDNPYQPDALPASVNRPIPTENKGRTLLQKMGWSEGERLGKSQDGISEPIQVNLRASQTAGLGSGQYEASMDSAPDLATQSKWVKAQQRYHQTHTPGGNPKPEEKRKPVQKFVQGQTIKFNLAVNKATGLGKTGVDLDTGSGDEEEEVT